MFRFLVVICGLVLSFTSKAQLDYGIEIGLNAGAPIPSKKVAGAKGTLGISPIAGLALSYDIKRNLQLYAGAYYDRKQASYHSPVHYPYIVVSGDSIDSFSGIVNGRFNNKYILLPLGVRYRLNKNIHIGGGTYFGYLLQGANKGLVTEGTAGYNGLFKIDDQIFDESKNINKLDVGLNCCARFYVLKQVYLQWQINYGITSVTKKTDNFKDKTHNTYTYLNLGYTF